LKPEVTESSWGGRVRVKVSPPDAESGTAQVRSRRMACAGPACVWTMLTPVIAPSISAADARLSCVAPTIQAKREHHERGHDGKPAEA